MGIGETAALSAAFLWTLSSMLWGQVHLSAMTLNFCKNLIGIVLIAIHLGVMGLVMGESPMTASAASWGWLALSGLVGIVAGDALFFRSLQILGPRISLMLATTSPFFSSVLGIWILGEALTPGVVTGIALTVSGVIVVVADRRAKNESPGLLPGSLGTGIVCGVLGALCQATGGVLARMGMIDGAGEPVCGAMEATMIRVLVAAGGTLVWVSLAGSFRKTVARAFHWDQLKRVIPATALGTWLGIYLSQVAYQQADAAIAQTLLATCPLFAIPIVWFLKKQPITMIGWLGTLMAVGGIALIARS